MIEEVILQKRDFTDQAICVRMHIASTSQIYGISDNKGYSSTPGEWEQSCLPLDHAS